MSDEHKLVNLMPVTIQDKQLMANYLAKSGLMPKDLNTGEKVFVALQMGHELGLSPMIAVNNISVINGKPVLSADIQVAVVRKHPEFAGIKIEDDGETCTVTVKRKASYGEESFIGSFSNKEAQEAQLTGKDNWRKFPKRMRKHRATAYAIRDAFPDGLAGFYTREEMEDGVVIPASDPVKEDKLFGAIVNAISSSPVEKRMELAQDEIEQNKSLTKDQVDYLEKTFCDTPKSEENIIDGVVIGDVANTSPDLESQAPSIEEETTDAMLNEIEEGMAKEGV